MEDTLAIATTQAVFRAHTLVYLPLHAFGFGADHDSDTLHSIAEASGGTFSFIEDEDVMQDAFAQCICRYPVTGIPTLTAARQDPRSYP